MKESRIVVIGAGVVGAAVADELIARGATDVTVLDQGDIPLTGGSSSHAPGLVFQASPSKTLTELAAYTAEKLSGLTYEGEPCYLRVGGLEVATTPERLRELTRRHGWLTSYGVAAQLVDTDRCYELFPLLGEGTVLGGLYNPTDGLAKAVRAVGAQTERAAAGGATLLPRTPVRDLVIEGGAVRAVVTDEGEIPADIVVCCAGIWGPLVAGLAGVSLPLTPVAHQLAWTSTVEGLDGSTEAALPILRHQDADLYYRQREDGLGIGYYDHRPMPTRPEDIRGIDEAAGMPSVQEFTPADFEPAWKETQRLLPATAGADVTDGINGLMSFTPDNLPIIGETSAVSGFIVAEAVWVTHSAGVGRAVAELIIDGVSSYDLSGCDVSRFEPHQHTRTYARTTGTRNFIEVYDILHPLQPPEELRPLRTSPFYPRQAELGAVFLPAHGWERPQWYESNADLPFPGRVPEPDSWAAQFWSPICAAEAHATRTGVAMYDMSALSRIEVTGPGAAAFLNSMVSNNVDKSVGAVTYCLMLGLDGGIRSDVTVARLGPEHFQLGGNGPVDVAWLEKHLPLDRSVQVRDITSGTCCIGVWGPKAREVVQPLTESDLGPEGLKYFRGVQTALGPIPVTMLRVSYVGELGWEIYTTADYGLALWDLLASAGAEHGIIAAGGGAFNSLRLEKGYRAFGTDMTPQHLPDAAGVGFAVRPNKGYFIGRDALLRHDGNHAQRLVCLVFADQDDVALGHEPVYAGDTPVGYVTSSAYGFTLGCGIAYAWVDSDYAAEKTRLQVGYFDRRMDATVTAEPLFDPGMSRLRG